LSAEIPAQFIVFDLLIWEGEAVWELPLEQRRQRVDALEGFVLSPATRSAGDARAWLAQFEALGLDGVVAKRLAATYQPGSRDAVVKVKEHRTADCVVLGLRWKGDQKQIATLLLGLYREDGGLDYVGSCAVAAGKRGEVAGRVLPLLEDAPEGRISEPNRWGSGELQEARVRPELVVEVRYDKVQGHRFRHGTKLIRWREDKNPQDCTWREVRPPRGDGGGVEALLG
jgi:ATP-dependent DNA ligase